MSSYKKYLRGGDECVNRTTLRRWKTNSNEEFNENEVNMKFQRVEQVEELVDNSTFLNDDDINVDAEDLYCNFQDDVDDTHGNFDESNLDENTFDESNFDNHRRKKIRNLKDFIDSDNFSRPITAVIDKTLGEVFLMILLFCVTNCLSMTAMTNLFKLINAIFTEPILPDSRYLIDKIVNPREGTEFHAICHNCNAYAGKFDEIQKANIKSCRICEATLDLSNPSSNLNYFVLINPSTQIANMLNANASYYDYIVNERIPKENCIEDIYDGTLYKEFKSNLPHEEKGNYVTAIINTDGAPKFKCSKFSIWPLYLILNELPPQFRLNNPITCGLYFHRDKPEMSAFLEPFVKLMNQIRNEGIPCIVNQQIGKIKPYILICCVDSVARAPIQGVKQYNGNFGCGWCLHPGQWSHGSMKYPLLAYIPQQRDHAVTIQEMFQATPENPINGMKYPSTFINLQNFNIILGFVPDYLHCCLEGVAKQFTEYYLQSMNLTEQERQNIDSVIKAIAFPHQLTRATRPLSVRNDWKAREWENFILYISVVIFRNKISDQLFKHWLLFIDSIYILLQSNIIIEDLNYADEMLHLFVAKVTRYFDIKAMTYNVHQLIHLAESVLNWGPLWAHSTFPFESANYQLQRAIKSARGVSEQIVRFVNLNNSIFILRNHVYPGASDIVKYYCENVLTARHKNTTRMSNIIYFGKSVEYNTDDWLTSDLYLSNCTKCFFRIIKNQCLYTSYRGNLRSNDSFAQLDNNLFIQIIKFIIDSETNQEYTICHNICTTDYWDQSRNKLKKIEFIEEQLTVVSTNCIKSICVYVEVSNMRLLCPVPNLLHY